MGKGGERRGGGKGKGMEGDGAFPHFFLYNVTTADKRSWSLRWSWQQ